MGISIGLHSIRNGTEPRYAVKATIYPASSSPFFDVCIHTSNGDTLALFFEDPEEARQFALDLAAAVATHGTYPDEPADIAQQIEADPFADGWRTTDQAAAK